MNQYPEPSRFEPQHEWVSPAPVPVPPPPGESSFAEAAPAKPRRVWVPVLSAALLASIVASAGTVVGMSLAGDQATAPASMASVGHTTQAVPVSQSTAANPNWEEVTAAVAPSVVAIQVQTPQGQSQGSGVIVDQQGRVVTNNHVVAGASSVVLTLSDGRLVEAKVLGTDPATDLAVVQMIDAPKDISPARFGDSDAVAVGEPVLAVGNPLGLAHTATTGIVSAVDRPVSAAGGRDGEPVVTNAIQIDAAVNPGNSGGPLFNARGEVVGITSSIATMSGGGQGGSIGLGFAIPAKVVQLIQPQLVESGSAEHAFLGVSMSDGTATAEGITRRGAVVEQVGAGTPAGKAGLVPGDVVVAIEDHAVVGAESLTGFVRASAVGDEVSLTVVRDGKVVTLPVTLAARPA